MQSYRERLITTAASMAINILANQAVAKTEEARRELGNQAYTLLEYALVPDSVRGELPVTPEIEAMLEEVATLAEFQSKVEAAANVDNETTATPGMSSAAEIALAFRNHPVASTNAKVLLEDATNLYQHAIGQNWSSKRKLDT